MEDSSKIGNKRMELGFWKWATASVLIRLIFSYFSENLNLSSRPEVSTPLTSLRRRNSSLTISESHICICIYLHVCIFYWLMHIYPLRFLEFWICLCHCSGGRLLAQAIVNVALFWFVNTHYISAYSRIWNSFLLIIGFWGGNSPWLEIVYGCDKQVRCTMGRLCCSPFLGLLPLKSNLLSLSKKLQITSCSAWSSMLRDFGDYWIAKCRIGGQSDLLCRY